ncbi:hypothetical protein EWM16_18200 [Clostridioides difficile]|nr:hypothetical protein BZ168_16360 [Clostridioides difficile]EHJ40686.1 hypothetical protein HMPREF9945_00289 [Clostridioides difficile 70-100-2010]ASN88162.1 hypothetical protein CGC51_02210 [Clostridioides difficile]AUA24204.1 hypothetical protein CWR56_01640 [Clostridioides difficile]EAA0006886.1 hypothetical protein [Clostridioides difficile]
MYKVIKTVEKIEGVVNLHKHYVFVGSRRFFYCLCLWYFFLKMYHVLHFVEDKFAYIEEKAVALKIKTTTL